MRVARARTLFRFVPHEGHSLVALHAERFHRQREIALLPNELTETICSSSYAPRRNRRRQVRVAAPVSCDRG